LTVDSGNNLCKHRT